MTARHTRPFTVAAMTIAAMPIATTLCAVATGLYLLTTSLSGTLQPGTQAPQASGRLNQVIERFQQGLPSFNNEQWRYIAMEHAPWDTKEVVQILKSLKPEGAARPRLTPIIRMPQEADDNFKWAIKQALDVGVMGVIMPHVTSKQEAINFVKAMRFPPQRGAKHPEPVGVRGWGPTGAVPYWGLNNRSYTLEKADVWPLNPEGELLAIVMIESREGVKHIDEILAVPGVSGALVGPSDLSMDLGVGPDPAHPEVEAMTATVAKACLARKALCGTFQSPDVKKRVEQGFRLFTGAAGNYQG